MIILLFIKPVFSSRIKRKHIQQEDSVRSRIMFLTCTGTTGRRGARSQQPPRLPTSLRLCLRPWPRPRRPSGPLLQGSSPRLYPPRREIGSRWNPTLPSPSPPNQASQTILGGECKIVSFFHHTPNLMTPSFVIWRILPTARIFQSWFNCDRAVKASN